MIEPADRKKPVLKTHLPVIEYRKGVEELRGLARKNIFEGRKGAKYRSDIGLFYSEKSRRPGFTINDEVNSFPRIKISSVQ